MTSSFDQYREDVIGRANVAETPERVRYYPTLQDFPTGALWTIANKIEPWEPAPPSVPFLWRYDNLRDRVMDALELVSQEEAERHGGSVCRRHRRPSPSGRRGVARWETRPDAENGDHRDTLCFHSHGVAVCGRDMAREQAMSRASVALPPAVRARCSADGRRIREDARGARLQFDAALRRPQRRQNAAQSDLTHAG